MSQLIEGEMLLELVPVEARVLERSYVLTHSERDLFCSEFPILPMCTLDSVEFDFYRILRKLETLKLDFRCTFLEKNSLFYRSCFVIL